MVASLLTSVPAVQQMRSEFTQLPAQEELDFRLSERPISVDAPRLQSALNQLRSLQVILDGLRITGKVELGNVKQVSEGQGSAKQLMGRNWQVDGDVKIDDITQENSGGK